MMPRAALYARYSSDNQRRTSIDDQLRLARERCAREGWHVVAEHHDAEISAATPVGHRPGSRALVAGALAGAYDVLVLEALDRLARNLGDQERVVERLEYRGVRIVCTSDGYDSALDGREITRGVRGLFNAQYLRDLSKKTHRGQAGTFARGRHVGGLQYGYRSEPTADGTGRVLAVDAAQAAVVVRVYEAFAGGGLLVELDFAPRDVLEELRLADRAPLALAALRPALFDGAGDSSGAAITAAHASGSSPSSHMASADARPRTTSVHCVVAAR